MSDTVSRVDKIKRILKIKRDSGKCTICPIRDGENRKAKHRKRNHGQQPKYKDKR